MNSQLLDIINLIRSNKSLSPLDAISPETRLREDAEMDSLDLAEFTVRVESQFGKDVFADGIVNTIGEVMAKLD